MPRYEFSITVDVSADDYKSALQVIEGRLTPTTRREDPADTIILKISAKRLPGQ